MLNSSVTKQPRGRPRKGCKWDPKIGQWAGIDSFQYKSYEYKSEPPNYNPNPSYSRNYNYFVNLSQIRQSIQVRMLISKVDNTIHIII